MHQKRQNIISDKTKSERKISMKKKSILILTAILALCLCLAGCKASEKEKLANGESFLMRVCNTPHEELVEIQDSLPITFNEEGTLGGVTEEDMQPFYDAAYELLKDGMEPAAAEKYARDGAFGSFFTDPIDTITPISVTFDGSENNYGFTMTVNYTHNGSEEAQGTVGGRIQFNDEGEINYISIDSYSWY